MEQACGRTFFLTDATIEASRPQRPDAVPFARSAVARVGGFEDLYPTAQKGSISMPRVSSTADVERSRSEHRVILDRDPLYTAAFRRLLRDSGVTPVVLPAWSPNINAFAERFVESAKAECLDRMVLLGEGHLRAAIKEFVRRCHEERRQHGLGNEFIAPQATKNGTGPMKCCERLGGLLKFYYPRPRGRSIELSHRTG